MLTGLKPGAVDCSRLAPLVAVSLPVLNPAVVLGPACRYLLCCSAWQLVVCCGRAFRLKPNKGSLLLLLSLVYPRYATSRISSACRAMEQPSHYPVPVPAGYAGGYPATFWFRPDLKKKWIRYIPSSSLRFAERIIARTYSGVISWLTVYAIN